MSMSDDLPVLIVGAGTGGMALAHGLRRAGVPVRVFERDRTRTGGLQGYRVGISPNGVRALRACLPSELFDTFVATAARDYTGYGMYTERFARLVSISSDDLRADELIKDYSVSRTTLRQVLLTGMADVVEFDRRFARFTVDGDTVTAHFEDGEQATGSVLVGADGANSRVRTQYLPRASQTETGLVAIGGKVALTDDVREMLPPAARNAMSMFFDKRGGFGVLHVMEFPRGAPDDDHVSWGVSASRTLLPSDVLEMDGARLQETVLRDVMDGWHPTLRTLVRDSDPTTAFALRVRTSDPLEPWTPSRITLLGDAIHTMTPGRGAGANTALRDAALLCDRLAALGTADPVAAIGEYEQRMRVYSAVAVRESLEFMNDGGTARRPVIGPLTTFGMRTALRLTDRVPALKRRMSRGMQAVRDDELDHV